MEIKEKFEYTLTPQDAVFYIMTGCVGGSGGDMVIIDNNTQNPLEYNGLAIYFDQNFGQQVQSKLPTCIDGRPEIVISATIQLKEKRGTASTEEETETIFYEAEVIKLNSIQVKADSCDVDSIIKEMEKKENK